MFLKSSLSLLILKVGSSTPLSLSSFTFTFWWLCHCGWFHSLSVYHLKRRRLPWKLVEINVQNLKFNSMVPKSPKQQKTINLEKYNSPTYLLSSPLYDQQVKTRQIEGRGRVERWRDFVLFCLVALWSWTNLNYIIHCSILTKNLVFLRGTFICPESIELMWEGHISKLF